MTEKKGKLSFLSRADGSGEFCHGQTIIWCGINGPGDIQSSKRIYDRVNLQCSFNKLIDKYEVTKPAKNSKDALDASANRFITSIVENAVDLFAYPRTCIQICTQEICLDGAALSTTLNAICLALLDSAIRLRHIFAAVTVAKVGKDFIVEPNGLKLVGATSVYTFVFKPSITEIGGSLIANECCGYFNADDYNKSLQLARNETLEIFTFFRQKVFDKFGNYLPTKLE